MKDRDVEIGNVDSIDTKDIYSSPKANVVDHSLYESVRRYKKWMEYSFFALIVVTLIPAILRDAGFDFPVAILFYSAPALWLFMLVCIFMLNKVVNSLGDAIFRVIISLVPILALYVVYRSSYDAKKAIALSGQKT